MQERMIRLADEEKTEEKEITLGKRLLKARVIMVSETITDKLARSVAAQCILMQEEDDKAPITVYVNSPGGSADSGFAMYDMLRFITPPIRTVCSGLCASAAVLVYLATEKNSRYSLPNSRFLLHQPSTTLFGAASDIEINANEIIKLRERYNKIVAVQTGKEVDQITQDSDRDFWLSPEESLEYGLVGKIITSFDEMK